MLIIFDSKTGNVERFVKKIDMDSLRIKPGLIVPEPFILVTYTTGFGQIPSSVLDFLKDNHQNMMAVSASGNRNWGQNFGKSADLISGFYNVPVLSKFEMFGTENDVQNFIKGVMRLETCSA